MVPAEHKHDYGKYHIYRCHNIAGIGRDSNCISVMSTHGELESAGETDYDENAKGKRYGDKEFVKPVFRQSVCEIQYDEAQYENDGIYACKIKRVEQLKNRDADNIKMVYCICFACIKNDIEYAKNEQMIKVIKLGLDTVLAEIVQIKRSNIHKYEQAAKLQSNGFHKLCLLPS